jgi:hypothetical protein
VEHCITTPPLPLTPQRTSDSEPAAQWGSQSWLPPAFSRRPDTPCTSDSRGREGSTAPRITEYTRAL